MARKAATIEYLERLVTWSGGRPSFCAKTGIKASNLSAYINGTKRISWDALENASKKVFGEPPAFLPVVEGFNLKTSGLPTMAQLPTEPGIYALYDSAMRVIYFGKATSLYMEVRQTLKRHVAEVRPWTGSKSLTFRDITTYISAFSVARGDGKFIHDVEALCLRILVNNTFNKNGGSLKRKA
jgi:hypothetical protein